MPNIRKTSPSKNETGQGTVRPQGPGPYNLVPSLETPQVALAEGSDNFISPSQRVETVPPVALAEGPDRGFTTGLAEAFTFTRS